MQNWDLALPLGLSARMTLQAFLLKFRPQLSQKINSKGEEAGHY